MLQLLSFFICDDPSKADQEVDESRVSNYTSSVY